MSLQAVESGPPSQISDTVSAAGVLDLAMQIAGRLLVGRHVGQRRRLVAAEIEVQVTSTCARSSSYYPAPRVPPVTCVRIIQSDVIDFSRYARWSGCRSRSAVACRSVRLPPSAGHPHRPTLSAGHPHRPTLSAGHPHRPTPPSVVGFDVRQRWRWRGAAVQHLVAGPPDHSDVWLPARPAASGV
jgi:hypothetical protein